MRMDKDIEEITVVINEDFPSIEELLKFAHDICNVVEGIRDIGRIYDDDKDRQEALKVLLPFFVHENISTIKNIYTSTDIR